MKELILQAKTEITANNLPDFAKDLRALLKGVNTDLKTDDDFATAKELVKKFDLSEKALKEAKERIFESGEFNELSDECRTVRLELNRTVTAKEKQVKQELIDKASQTIKKAFDDSVMYAYLTIEWSDIANEIKGKKLLSKMEEALNTYVGVKINAIQIEETALLTKLKLIQSLVKDNEHLFNLENLMRIDGDYEEHIKSRIQENDEAIAEKAKIEAARLVEQERQANAKAEADRLARKAKEQVQNEVVSQVQPGGHIPEKVQSDKRVHHGVTETLNHVTKHNDSTLPPIECYRIRLDVTCCLDEAKSIANELKVDYSRLNALVSLSQVSHEKVA